MRQRASASASYILCQYAATIYCLLILTTTVTSKPFKHYGRCKIGLEDGYCVRNDDCTEQNEDSFEIGKCGSMVVSNLICCARKQTATIDKATEAMSATIPIYNLPAPPVCGLVGLDDLIFGGVTAHITDFPWMVLLLYTIDNINYDNRCGGSLISDRWVVTAAHCVRNVQIASGYRMARVRLGEWDTTRNPDCEYFRQGHSVCAPHHIEVDVDGIFVHENYDQRTQNLPNDIALVRLANVVEFSDFIRPICLPADNAKFEHAYENVVMDIAGWGNTETSRFGNTVKRKTSLRIWSNDNCRRFSGDASDRQICAGGYTNASSCHGDSGGPLIYQDNNRIGGKSFYLTGIISLGAANCSSRGQPVIFTKVENYVSWIVQSISENN